MFTASHLTIWLQTRQMMKYVTNSLMLDNLPDIIEIFGGVEKVMNLLIKQGQEVQLHSLNNLLMKIAANPMQSKCMIDHKTEEEDIAHENILELKSDTNMFSNSDYKENEDDIKTDNELEILPESKLYDFNFAHLSDDSISYILGFLDRRSFGCSKHISIRWALVCLAEMQKSTVGIILAREKLYEKYCKETFDTCTVSFTRYRPSMTFETLFEKWAKDYRIPVQHQLIFYANGAAHKELKLFTDHKQIIKHLTKKIGLKAKLVLKLFDLRETCTILSSDEHYLSLTNDEISAPISIADNIHKLITLLYFNVEEQAQYILLNLWIFENISLRYMIERIELEIIEFEFGNHLSIDMQTAKYKRLLSNVVYNLKHMNSYSNHQLQQNKISSTDISSKFLLFFDISNVSLQSSTNTIKQYVSQTEHLFCLQLNTDHIWFNVSPTIKLLKNEKLLQMEKFYTKYDEFAGDIHKFSIDIHCHFNRSSWILIAKNIRYYCNNISPVLNSKHHRLLRNIPKNGKFSFMVSASYDWTLIRHKICHELNDIFQPSNIEILYDNSTKVVDNNQSIGDLMLTNTHGEFSWHITDYNTTFNYQLSSVISSNVQFFSVSFVIQQPFGGGEYRSYYTKMLVRFTNQPFIVRDLLKVAVEQMSKPLFYKQFLFAKGYSEMHKLVSPAVSNMNKSKKKTGLKCKIRKHQSVCSHQKFTMVIENTEYDMDDEYIVPSVIYSSNDVIGCELKVEDIWPAEYCLSFRFTKSTNFNRNTHTLDVEDMLLSTGVTVKISADQSLESILKSDVNEQMSGMEFEYPTAYTCYFVPSVGTVQNIFKAGGNYSKCFPGLFLRKDPQAFIVIKILQVR